MFSVANYKGLYPTMSSKQLQIVHREHLRTILNCYLTSPLKKHPVALTERDESFHLCGTVLFKIHDKLTSFRLCDAFLHMFTIWITISDCGLMRESEICLKNAWHKDIRLIFFKISSLWFQKSLQIDLFGSISSLNYKCHLLMNWWVLRAQ